MDRKQVLIEVLNKLIPYWNLAEGFLALVKQTQDDDFIESLFVFIKTQISQIKDKKIKQDIIEQIENIKKMKNKEIDSSKKDTEEADKMIDDLISNNF
jgi:hypothetical protein